MFNLPVWLMRFHTGEAEMTCECVGLWVLLLGGRVRWWGRGYTLQVGTGQAQRNHVWPRSHSTSLYWAVKDDAGLCVWHLVCTSWKEGMPCHGFSQMLSGFLHHSQQLPLDIQSMWTMHCQNTVLGAACYLFFLIGISLGGGIDQQEIAPPLCTNQEPCVRWFKRKNHIAWAFDGVSEAGAKLYLCLSCLG